MQYDQMETAMAFDLFPSYRIQKQWILPDNNNSHLPTGKIAFQSTSHIFDSKYHAHPWKKKKIHERV